MKKVEAFETSDGKLFRTEQDAKEYEKDLEAYHIQELKKLYEELGGLIDKFVSLNNSIPSNKENEETRFKNFLAVIKARMEAAW